jgi:glycosyltransferase involved in cell wall biosynthesis
MGGVERVVAIHAAELARRGHRVTVFAAASSEIPNVKIVPYGQAGVLGGKRELLRLALKRFRQDAFHLVHSFGRSTTLLPVGLGNGSPLIQTYQCPLSQNTINNLDRWFPRRISYTVPSVWMQKGFPVTASPIAVVPNSLPEDQYTPSFNVSPDAPLAFLGRFDPCKGLHTAIEAAVAAGHAIEIGGAAFDAPSREYEARIREQWMNHPLVHFLGPLNDNQKQSLLQRSAALLFPIEWEEPFGIVMIEAMACGTPVIAFRRGAVPEVVLDGLNGLIVDHSAGMVEAIAKLPSIDRHQVRDTFTSRYSAAAITDQYLEHYANVLQRSAVL